MEEEARVHAILGLRVQSRRSTRAMDMTEGATVGAVSFAWLGMVLALSFPKRR